MWKHHIDWDAYYDPPDEPDYADCEVCGERRDLSDMECVDDMNDIWVCDCRDTDCLEEWYKKHPQEDDDEQEDDA